jgi:hypothetical protein
MADELSGGWGPAPHADRGPVPDDPGRAEPPDVGPGTTAPEAADGSRAAAVAAAAEAEAAASAAAARASAAIAAAAAASAEAEAAALAAERAVGALAGAPAADPRGGPRPGTPGRPGTRPAATPAQPVGPDGPAGPARTPIARRLRPPPGNCPGSGRPPPCPDRARTVGVRPGRARGWCGRRRCAPARWASTTPPRSRTAPDPVEATPDVPPLRPRPDNPPGNPVGDAVPGRTGRTGSWFLPAGDPSPVARPRPGRTPVGETTEPMGLRSVPGMPRPGGLDHQPRHRASKPAPDRPGERTLGLRPTPPAAAGTSSVTAAIPPGSAGRPRPDPAGRWIRPVPGCPYPGSRPPTGASPPGDRRRRRSARPGSTRPCSAGSGRCPPSPTCPARPARSTTGRPGRRPRSPAPGAAVPTSTTTGIPWTAPPRGRPRGRPR